MSSSDSVAAGTVEAKVAAERWAALEANPEVLTSLCHQLGVAPTFQVVDVFGLEPDLLGFVPQPALALILLFPSKPRDAEARVTSVAEHEVSPRVYYLTQLRGHLDNACGTIAVLHSVLNNRDILGLSGDPGCVGERFYQQTRELGHDERGKCLDTFQDIVTLHNKLVGEGQSRVVESNQVNRYQESRNTFDVLLSQVRHHFVSITAVEGHLVELDGAYNSGPNVIRKLEAGQDFLSAAAEFVKEKYISKSGEEAQFALMALVMGHGD